MNTLSLIQVREKAQITLPNKIRKFFDIKAGDYLEAKVRKEGIMLTPKLVLDKLPEIELSREGERMLKEGLEDVKHGRIKKFSNAKDLIKELNN